MHILQGIVLRATTKGGFKQVHLFSLHGWRSNTTHWRLEDLIHLKKKNVLFPLGTFEDGLGRKRALSCRGSAFFPLSFALFFRIHPFYSAGILIWSPCPVPSPRPSLVPRTPARWPAPEWSGWSSAPMLWTPAEPTVQPWQQEHRKVQEKQKWKIKKIKTKGRGERKEGQMVYGYGCTGKQYK